MDNADIDFEDSSVAFLSYRRTNAEFVHKCRELLSASEIKSLVDTQEIKYGDEWKSRIFEMLVAADATILFISKDFFESEVCRWEIEESMRMRKRVLPVICDPGIAIERLPAIVRELDLRYATDLKSFRRILPNIVEALSVDFAWHREHKRYTDRALKWEDSERDKSLLLRGIELESAQHLCKRAPKNAGVAVACSRFVQASVDFDIDAIRERLEAAINTHEMAIQGLYQAACAELRSDNVFESAVVFRRIYEDSKAAKSELISLVTQQLSGHSLYRTEPRAYQACEALNQVVVQSKWLASDRWHRHIVCLMRQFPQLQQRLQTEELFVQSRLCPVGQSLAILSGGGGAQRISIYLADDLERCVSTIEIPRSLTPTQFAWSPDGQELVVVEDRSSDDPRKAGVATNYLSVFDKDTGSLLRRREIVGTIRSVTVSAASNVIHAIASVDGSMQDFLSSQLAHEMRGHVGVMEAVLGPLLGTLTSSASANAKASITAYSLKSLAELAAFTVEGTIDGESVQGDYLSFAAKLTGEADRACFRLEFVNGDGLNVAVYRSVQLPSFSDPGRIALSPCGRFLARRGAFNEQYKTPLGISVYHITENKTIEHRIGFAEAISYLRLEALDESQGKIILSLTAAENQAGKLSSPARQQEAPDTLYRYRIELNLQTSTVLYSAILNVPLRGKFSCMGELGDNDSVVIGENSGSVQVWQSTFNSPRSPRLPHESSILAIHSLGGDRFLVATSDGTIERWTLQTNSCEEFQDGRTISVLSKRVLQNQRLMSLFIADDESVGMLRTTIDNGVECMTMFHLADPKYQLEIIEGLPASNYVLWHSKLGTFATVFERGIEKSHGDIQPLMDIVGVEGLPDTLGPGRIHLVDTSTPGSVQVFECEGPIITLEKSPCENYLFLVELVSGLKKSRCRILDAISHEQLPGFNCELPPIVQSSISHDLSKAGVVTTNGEPLLVKRDGSIRSLDGDRASEFRHFGMALISCDATCVLLQELGGNREMRLVDTETGKRTVVRVQEGEKCHIVCRFDSHYFIVGTDRGELIIVDGSRGEVTYRRFFPTAISAIEIEDGLRIAAVRTRSGAVHLLSLPNGEPFITDLAVPHAGDLTTLDDVYSSFPAKFSNRGNYFIERFPILSVNLTDLSNLKLDSPLFIRDQGFRTTGLDSALRKAKDLAGTHSNGYLPASLDALAHRKDLPLRWRLEKHLKLAVTAGNLGDIETARRALDFVLQHTSIQFSWSNALALAKCLRYFDAARGLEFCTDYIESHTWDSSLERSQLLLVRASCQAAVGEWDKASEDYTTVCGADYFQAFELKQPLHTLGIRIEQVLVGLSVSPTNSESLLASCLGAYSRCNDANIVATLHWVHCLADATKLLQVTDKDHFEIRRLRDPETLAWYRFMAAPENRKAEAVRNLTHSVPEKLLPIGHRPLLPMANPHLIPIRYLTEVVSASRPLTFPNSKDCLELADAAWIDLLSKGATALFDRRSLWPWEISLKLLYTQVERLTL